MRKTLTAVSVPSLPPLSPTRTTHPSATPLPPTATPTGTPTARPALTRPSEARLRIGELQCSGRDEYVRVDNVGGATAELDGWRIVSVVGTQTYDFARHALAPGTSVYVHSGPDAPPTGGNHLRWTTAYRWNNDGDEAELRDPSGAVVDTARCGGEG